MDCADEIVRKAVHDRRERALAAIRQGDLKRARELESEARWMEKLLEESF